MSALARQFCGQFASKRLQRLLQTQHLFFVGMHKFDVFGQGFTQCLGHRLGATISHEPSANFCFNFLLKLFDPALKLIFFKTLFKFRQLLSSLIAVCFHQFVEHVVEIQIAQRAI